MAQQNVCLSKRMLFVANAKVEEVKKEPSADAEVVEVLKYKWKCIILDLGWCSRFNPCVEIAVEKESALMPRIDANIAMEEKW